ncbi:MAG: penicillin-binding protein 2 [Gallionella sp.]|nr:penicillin-binding protein 2 [Gallionella sp.]
MSYAASAKKEIPASLPGWRASVLFVLLLAGLVALLGRAIYLQGFHDDFLQAKGNARYSRVIEVNAHRGMITDRHGEVLAMSTPVESVWASPADVVIDDKQLRKLAQILGVKAEELKSKLADTSRDFVYLKRQLPPEQVDRVVRMNLPGISLKREYRRYYSAGAETAQVLGITGQDDSGQEGLELALQSHLAGKPGSQRVIKDRRGRIVEDAGSLHAPKPGGDVVLSLDIQVQHVVYRELEAAVKDHHAKAGAVVVLDSRTGEVLALANYPSYNPNIRADVGPQGMRNRAITDLFEPGSTMKPFAVAAALEQGKVKPENLINTEHGVMMVGNRKIHDSHPESLLTVAQIIQKSSNVGVAKLALMLSPAVMWQSLSDSGFGELSGSGFPGEAAGKLRDHKTWKPIEQATMSYGHGVSVNLLQLARAYTIFANDGELKSVSMMRLDAPAVGGKVFSERTARQMRDMMELVVQPGGTAPLAQVPGYRIAGKTGTAHKLEGGRYVDKYVASFVGLAPASAPRLIVAVMIDEPTGLYYGGQVAAPVFSKVAAAALHALDVPHDAPLDNVIAPPTDIVREEV